MLARLTSGRIIVEVPKHLRGKPPKVVQRQIRESEKEKRIIGPSVHPCGGSCCLDCRRPLEWTYVRAMGTDRQQHRAMVLNQCEWCGRER